MLTSLSSGSIFLRQKAPPVVVFAKKRTTKDIFCKEYRTENLEKKIAEQKVDMN